MLNNVDLRLVLHRNSDSFCLMSWHDNAAYKLHVINMRWYMKGVEVSKPIVMGIERTLQQFTAKYPVKRVEVKSFHVTEGRRETPENALFNGQMPKRLVVGCLAAAAYHGSYRLSPFNFQHFGIQES